MYSFVKNSRFLLGAGAVVAAMASCKPTTIDPVQPAEATTGFQQVRPTDSFTWSTSRNVTLVVTGLNVGANIVKPLQIQALSGEVFYTRMHNIDQNLSIGIMLPGHLDKVRVVYGDISKELSITNGKLEFDFIQPAAPVEGE